MKCFTLEDGGIAPAIPLRRTEMGQVALDLLEVLIPLEKEWGQRTEALCAQIQKEVPGFRPCIFNAEIEAGYCLVPSEGADNRALVVLRHALGDRVVLPTAGDQGVDIDFLFGVVAGTSMVHCGLRESVVVLTPGTGFLVEHTLARPGAISVAELYYSFAGRLEVLRTEKARAQKTSREQQKKVA